MNIDSTRAAVLAMALAIYPLAGAAVEITPSITVGEIYSSNINLTSDANAPTNGQSKDDWVTRIAPRLQIGYQGSRLDLDIDYTIEALLYAKDSGRNEAYNDLNAAALLDLIGEDLQLRAQGSISQVNISPTEAVTNSNINTTGNRTDALIWDIGPQWRHQIFSNSEVDGYARVGRVDYNDPTVQDVDTTRGRLAVKTDGRSQSAVSYELAYEYDRLSYDITGDTTVQSAWLQLGYQLNDSVQVFGIGGLDSDFQDPTSTSLDQPRWELGAATTFGAESLRASFGHRFFGKTFSFSWNHDGNDISYGASYNESPSTTDLNTLREIPNTPPGTPPPTQPPPDPGINRPGNPTTFIYKRADANAHWKLYRSALMLDLFWEDRQDQQLVSSTPGETTSLNSDKSYGLDADLHWEPGSRSDASVGVGWRHQIITDLTHCDPNHDPQSCAGAPSNGDDLYSLRAGLDYTLGVHTDLNFLTGFQSRQGSSGGTSDYDEFWASVQLVRTF